MAVTRTVDLIDITPAELAEMFCNLNGEDQAQFFAEIYKISATWPGAGWCQQSYEIAANTGPKSREVILKLAEHVAVIGE